MNSWQHITIDFAIVALFIVAIWRFRSPRHARSANLTAAVVMACAVGIVVYRYPVATPVLVVGGLLVGTVLAVLTALRLNMIHIPSLIAFQNGAGGAAACIVALVQLVRAADPQPASVLLFGVLGIVAGAATFSGSMIASGKLANRLKQTPVFLPGHNMLLAGLVVAIVALGSSVGVVHASAFVGVILALTLCSTLLGIVFAIRIGGADMPVAISFLNATTGMAAAFCGICVQNRLLAACGALVAASGSILTHAMCKAMNRKLLNVFAGIRPPAGKNKTPDRPREEQAVLAEPAQPAQDGGLDGAVQTILNARKVIIVPGYGMALAQAQFEVARLADTMQGMGKEVKFAVHPVAGRMPGHMNVLLAEAGVDYDQLFEMDDVNPEFPGTDLALIVGACDVVNPAAIAVEGTPISGMPILNAHEAERVVICNLDEKPGYSGVENPLYNAARTILLLGDAKATVLRLLQAIDTD